MWTRGRRASLTSACTSEALALRLVEQLRDVVRFAPGERRAVEVDADRGVLLVAPHPVARQARRAAEVLAEAARRAADVLLEVARHERRVELRRLHGHLIEHELVGGARREPTGFLDARLAGAAPRLACLFDHARCCLAVGWARGQRRRGDAVGSTEPGSGEEQPSSRVATAHSAARVSSSPASNPPAAARRAPGLRVGLVGPGRRRDGLGPFLASASPRRARRWWR